MALQLLITLGPSESETLRWLALLLTYFAHALIWTLASALLLRSTKLSAARTNTLWKLTLLGPLATTFLSAGMPWAALWSWHAALPDLLARAALPGATEQGSAVLPAVARVARAGSSTSLLALLAAGSLLLGLLRFGSAVWRLSRTLRGRREVRDARLLARFELVRRRTRLRSVSLSESAHLTVPVVLGRAEICIPQGVLLRFDDEEIAAIFAHELAHLERGDGLWFPLVGLVQALLAMQPCNHLAGAKFRESAELACDDRAVELTDAPLGLARALTRMAELSLHRRRQQLVPAMVVASIQVKRVQRLVARRSADEGVRRSALTIPVGCLLSLGALSPTLHVERAQKASPSTERVDLTPAELADASAFADEMYAFALEEQRISAELALLQSASSAPSDQAKLLELEQDLRHTRALRAFSQARYERAHEHSLR